MSGRLNYFFKQKVTEAELDLGFSLLEQADRALTVDNLLVGVTTAGTVSQKAGTPNISVDVAAGTVYDKLGQRIAWGATQNINLAVDENNVSTTVTINGQFKKLGLFAKFKRNLTDPRTDGNSNTVYFNEAESFEFIVRQSAQSASPSPVALDATYILLADITRSFNQTQIFNADISTSRREDAIVATAGAFTVRAGTPRGGVQGLLTELNNHVTGVGGIHPATAISFNNAGIVWHNSEALTSATVQAMLQEIVDDLRVATPTSGAHRVGFEGANATWRDGTSLVNSSIQTAIDTIITTLAATAGVPGAKKVGFEPSQSTWLDGQTIIDTSIQDAIDSIPDFLAVNTGFFPGALKIGARASSGSELATGSVDSQLQELATEWGRLVRANTWTAAQTFNGASGDTNAALITTAAATDFKLLWSIACGTLTVRFYSTSSEIFVITRNAYWTGTQWNRDTALNSARWDFGFQFQTKYHPTASAVPWNDNAWESTMTYALDTGEVTGDGLVEQRSYVGTEGYSNGSSNIGGATNYRRKFASTPASVTYTGPLTDDNITGGPFTVSSSGSVYGHGFFVQVGAAGQAYWFGRSNSI